MRKLLRCGIATLVGIGALLAANAPATAITGGAEDLANTYSNVGMVVFYQPDGRFRCSGTLIAPQVVPHRRPLHLPGHRQGRRHVRPAHLSHRGGSRSRHPSRRRRRRTRRRDLGDRLHRGRHHFAGTRANRPGSSARRSPTPSTATSPTSRTGTTPASSSSTKLPGSRWHRSLRRTTSTTSRQPLLNSTSFLTIGYGTEVRKAESGPQTPTPMRQPIVRRYTTEIGQKLTDQILQLNGNEHDPRGGRRHLLRRLRRTRHSRRLRRG